MKKYLFISLLALTALSCENWKDQYPDKLNPDPDTTAPGKITVTSVENVKGGAVIHYSKPSDADFLGVKAVYDLNDTHKGVSTFSSAGGAVTDVSSITLEGFGDTIPHRVTLYAVDDSGNESEPVYETIQPEWSAVYDIAKSLETADAAGGIQVHWLNPDQEDIAIVISCFSEETGYWEPVVPLYFSTEEEVRKVIKGFSMDAVGDTVLYTEKEYKFEFIDKFENYYEAKISKHTPIEEYYISPYNDDGTTRRRLYGISDNTWVTRGDCGPGSTGFDASFGVEYDNTADYWWDNMAAESNRYFASLPAGLSTPWPYYFTIDMGVEAIFSTFVMFIQARDPLGSATMMSEFEIWGSKKAPKPLTEFGWGSGQKYGALRYFTSWDYLGSKDTDFLEIIHGDEEDPDNPYSLANTAAADYWETDGSWIKLADCKFVLPSGKTDNDVPEAGLSSEDKAFLTAGVNFEMEQYGSFRYLRFKVKNTTSGDMRSRVDCLQFLGRYPTE
jgi:hypothetical protein